MDEQRTQAPGPLPAEGATGDRKIVDSQLKGVRDFVLPNYEAAEFFPVEGSLTGDITQKANRLTLWSSLNGERPVVRGGYLSIVAVTGLRGPVRTYGNLAIYDDAGSIIMPVGPYYCQTPAGYVFSNGPGNLFRFNLLEGNEGDSSGDLLLGGTATIGTGSITVFGVVWGKEEV